MKHLIMGTAGHIDHGKTSLVKALTGIDCDTHKEEKLRGITINLGFSYLDLPDGESVGIIDVPGHRDFISTMVGGACGIDFVLLVISADSGIMPQTTEHVNIIHALGIHHGIVALTKADIVDGELLDVARLEIHEFLENTALHSAPVIPVSAVTGMGLPELKNAIAEMVSGIEEKESAGSFRMYIDRVFSVKGFGSVVTGSVLGGSISVEQEVYLLPGDHGKLRVRSLERHGKTTNAIRAGDRAAINLIGLEKQNFQRGMILSGKQMKPSGMLDVLITLFDQGATLPLWTQVNFHTGTFESAAKIHNLNKDINLPGEILAQVHLARPAPLMANDRFILRNSSGSSTVGGGVILDTNPLHHRKKTAELYDNLNVLSQANRPGSPITGKIGIELKKEFRPFTLEEIAGKLDIDTLAIKTEVESSNKAMSFYHSPENCFLIDRGFEKKLMQKVTDALDQHHRENPIFPTGCDVVALAGKTGLGGSRQDKDFLALFLERMEENGQVEKVNNTYIIKGFRPSMDSRTLEEIGWLENEILDYGVNIPVFTELLEKAMARNIAKGKLKMYVSYLTGTGRIIYFQGDFLHRKHVDIYRPVLLEMLSQNDGIEINEFKNRISATKRFCAVLVGIFETEKNIRTKGSGIETRLYLNAQKKM